MPKKPISNASKALAKIKKTEEAQDKQLMTIAEHRRSQRQHELMDVSGTSVLEMFMGADHVGEAVKACGWTPQAELEILTEIAEDPDISPLARMKACDVIHQRIIFAMQCSGRVVDMVLRGEDQVSDNQSVISEMRAFKVVKDAAAHLQETRNDLTDKKKVTREEIIYEQSNSSRHARRQHGSTEGSDESGDIGRAGSGEGSSIPEYSPKSTPADANGGSSADRCDGICTSGSIPAVVGDSAKADECSSTGSVCGSGYEEQDNQEDGRDRQCGQEVAAESQKPSRAKRMDRENVLGLLQPKKLEEKSKIDG